MYQVADVRHLSENRASQESFSRVPVQTTPSSLDSDGPDTGTRLLRWANNASWFVNWFLLVAKLYAVIVSASKAVAAALADSIVDLLSQGVLAMAEHYIRIHSPDYPVGRSRLEALSVLACAGIMSMASVEVIQYSCIDLYSGLTGNIPELNVDQDLYIILGLGIFMKLVLYIFCRYANRSVRSDSLAALAEDHLNDVVSNIAAIVTAAIAFNTTAWYIDPVGAILISFVIIGRWLGVMAEQVRKVVGYTASPEFIAMVNAIATAHDSRLTGHLLLYLKLSDSKQWTVRVPTISGQGTMWRWRWCFPAR